MSVALGAMVIDVLPNGTGRPVVPESVQVAIFSDLAASKVKASSPSWSVLVDRIKEPTVYRTKLEMPLLMLASLGVLRSDGGSLRHGANVLSISGVALDYDGEEVSIADAATKLHGGR